MSRPSENTAFSRLEREDVAWSAQLVGPNVRVNEGFDGFGTVSGRNSGGAAVSYQVNTYRKRGFVSGVVSADHEVKSE